MASSAAVRERLARMGMGSLSPAEGLSELLA